MPTRVGIGMAKRVGYAGIQRQNGCRYDGMIGMIAKGGKSESLDALGHGEIKTTIIGALGCCHFAN